MSRWTKEPHQDGFNLAELLVVLALLSILLMIAVPSFNGFLARYRLSTAANDFLSGLTLTRNEALKRGRRVDMVPVNNNWENGWTVFVDLDNDQQVDSSEEIISVHEALADSLDVSRATASGQTCNAVAGTAFNDNGKVYVAYIGTGHSKRNSGGFLAGSVLFIEGQYQRCIVINATGRARITGS